jgi:hypothetical protein
MKMPKMKMPKVSKLLKDKNVLYVVSVLAMVNLVGLLLVRNFNGLLFFALFGFLATFFTKNMIIVLLTAMISTHLYIGSSKLREGMDNKKKVVNKAVEKKESSSDDEDDSTSENRVDYSKTLEKAYENLENQVGENGIEGLTNQTAKLLDQQKELMNNMKNAEPMLKMAEGFLEKLGGMDNIMGKLGVGKK